MAIWSKVVASGAVALALLVPAADAGTITYSYDALGRLVSATYPAGTKVAYAYDNAGNRTSQSTGANAVPIAVNDSFSTPKNTRIKYPVMNNDYSPTGASLSLSSVTTPSNGTTFTDTSHLQVYYTPNTGFTGTDSFTYTISDGSNQATATATVTVTP